ncbi:Ig-like domain-containing protein [Dysgonomonas sp. 521]|uniref:Ig-like domain-containing protein n=1 Tax=Dysgonomonas sp. 521 TaxID=2302932 RepID=UPI0013D5DC0D|nr:Ig-like domain-containing protein [Dysgonomonas sp. 521]NDV95371.1 Ig-like domain-containing protein [Dysgonomonas sp. 521]
MNKLIYIITAILTLTLFSACGGDDNNNEVVVLTSIAIDPVDKDLYIGDTYQLSVSHQPTDVKLPKLTWTSSDTKVATVSSSGKVTAVADGVAKITASYGDLSNSVTITIFKEISISKDFIVGTWGATGFGNPPYNAWVAMSPNKTFFKFYEDNTCDIEYEKNYILNSDALSFNGKYSISDNTVNIISSNNIEYHWNIIAIYNNEIVSTLSFVPDCSFRFIKN